MRLSTKVWHSPQVREELAQLAGDNDLNSETLVRAVRTRWNTVTDVLQRALEMRTVLTTLCKNPQFNKTKDRGMRLRRFLLDDEEWKVISELHSLLDVHP